MVKTVIVTGIVLEVLGLMLFLSVFVSAAFGMADHDFRGTALAFVRAPIGMGMMTIGGFMMMGGIIYGVVTRASKIAKVIEEANACRFCGAQRGGELVCPSCGARS